MDGFIHGLPPYDILSIDVCKALAFLLSSLLDGLMLGKISMENAILHGFLMVDAGFAKALLALLLGFTL
ncbi:MAG: hypothetical protein ACUVTL_10965 [Thermoproteota archaeon]